MSRLEDLYKAKEILRREKLELSDKQEKQLNELEEEIIKKEIIWVRQIDAPFFMTYSKYDQNMTKYGI